MVKALQSFWFKFEPYYKVGLRSLRLVTPFILSIAAVGLLMYFVVPIQTLNRGKEDTVIINKIPSKMPPLPKKSNKPYSPIFHSLLTTSYDSTDSR